MFFFDVATVDLRCYNIFLDVATVDLRCCNMFLGCYVRFQCVANLCSWMLQAMINIWSFVSISIFLPLERQGAVSVSTIGSATTITMVYYCITGERRELEDDERWGGTGRAKASGSEREGAQRIENLWIWKGRSAGVRQVEQKHPDQLFISGHPGASISRVVPVEVIISCPWCHVEALVIQQSHLN
jgi:hypothetical protein